MAICDISINNIEKDVNCKIFHRSTPDNLPIFKQKINSSFVTVP